jgi:hypothetical protein
MVFNYQRRSAGIMKVKTWQVLKTCRVLKFEPINLYCFISLPDENLKKKFLKLGNQYQKKVINI